MIKKENTWLIAEQARQLGRWLADEAPYVHFDQKHLDPGTVEQAYWHLGYKAALRDAVALLTENDASTPDTTSHLPSAELGE